MPKVKDYDGDGKITLHDIKEAKKAGWWNEGWESQDAMWQAYNAAKSLGTEWSPIEEAEVDRIDEADVEATGTIISGQTEASDIQLNAAPSQAAVSTLGMSPFSGTVNWNAIPGGFQPLPQTAGTRKKLYQLSQFHGGINQRSSPRDIADVECQKATNVLFSNIGRITLLGDCLNDDNSLKEFAAITNADLPGYGLFEFTSPADQDGNAGEEVILLTADGGQVDALSSGGGTDAGFIDMAGTDSGAISQIYYAAGSGVYVADASMTNTRKAKIYVYRADINGAVAVSGWSTTTDTLIASPTYHASGATNSVSPQASHADASGTGRMMVTIDPGANGTGSWGIAGSNVTYYFYVSWLFDNGCETGLSSIGTTNFQDHACDFNISIIHTNAAPVGGDKRIEGARIYFKESGTSERWMLGDVSFIDGVRGALDSTFIPWDNPTGNVYDLAANITFKAPPAIVSYLDNNTYYANEVYTKSPDATGTAPTAHAVKYKTVTTAANGLVYIGNVNFRGNHTPDLMMWSLPNKPGVFPLLNHFDSPTSDGSPITALVAFQDTILQFKQNGLFVINISTTQMPYAEMGYRNCGVFNPCQVFATSFGVIFANKHGCFIYDGDKVISLTGGKFDWHAHSGISESTADQTTSDMPCVGYDPRSQNIIVLKNIGDDTTEAGAWIYNMATHSWTESDAMITNADGTRHSNFIVTSEGYLSIKSSGDPTLLNYDHNPRAAQTITYITKDLDFGLPTQTKKIFKIYVTYQGDGSGVTVTYGADGDTSQAGALTNSENSSTTLTSADTTDHNVATLTLNSHPTNLKSIALKFTGSAGTDFEINDISILYRVRPIK